MAPEPVPVGDETPQAAPDHRLPRLDRATADIRNAVRAVLPAAGADPGRADPGGADRAEAGWIVAVSGGADSMALAAACAHLARTSRHRFHAVVVDHGLQEASDVVAHSVVGHLQALGLPAEVVPAHVDVDSRGVEAAARAARYRALDEVRAARGASCVLTGHTRDDQAETVLLGLVRGSGARSLAGMRPISGTVCRPLLGITREATRASCTAAGIPVWDDPMNAEARFTRVRVRTRVLPVLEAELGPGVAAALARTATRLAADSDALEDLAAAARPAHVHGREVGAGARHLPQAIRTRLLRDWLREQAHTAQEIGSLHVDEVDDLLCRRRTGAVSVPGAAEVHRSPAGGLCLRRPDPDRRPRFLR